MPAICIHDWLNGCKKKMSKLIRSGYYVFSGRGEFLNCLLLFRLSFAFAFNHNMAHSGSNTQRKGLCRISKSEMLASEMRSWGHTKKPKRRGVGAGCQCGTRRAEVVPQDLVSHRVLLQHYNRIRGETIPLNPIAHRKERNIV